MPSTHPYQRETQVFFSTFTKYSLARFVLPCFSSVRRKSLRQHNVCGHSRNLPRPHPSLGVLNNHESCGVQVAEDYY